MQTNRDRNSHNDISRDELRREIRSIDREQREIESAERALIEGIFTEVPAERRASIFLPNLDRRGFLRFGGIAVASTALLAACREAKPKKQIPISGDNPGYTGLSNQPINDVVILRTAASLELTVVNAYEQLIAQSFVKDAVVADLIKVFADHHRKHADAMAAATKALGGTPCTSSNPKIDSFLIAPLLERIATSGAEQGEDAKALAYSLESLAAATYQSVVPVLTSPDLRKAAMSVGSIEARHAAVLGAVINPSALVGTVVIEAPEAPADTTTTTVDAGLPTTAPAATTTTVQAASVANVIHAVPSAFGSLAPIPLTVGPANEFGVRPSVNLETPSLNSLMYDGEAC